VFAGRAWACDQDRGRGLNEWSRRVRHRPLRKHSRTKAAARQYDGDAESEDSQKSSGSHSCSPRLPAQHSGRRNPAATRPSLEVRQGIRNQLLTFASQLASGSDCAFFCGFAATVLHLGWLSLVQRHTVSDLGLDVLFAAEPSPTTFAPQKGSYLRGRTDIQGPSRLGRRVKPARG